MHDRRRDDLRRRRLPIAAALVTASLLPLIVAPPGLAADCGGSRPCACGDRVVEDYTLPENLGPCPKDGLRLNARVSLDGAGRTIRGSGAGAGTGVRIGEEASGSQVRALTVSKFAYGIRLIGARNVTLTSVETSSNGVGDGEGYGIDVADGASDNLIERARVHGNDDEGIHVGARAAGNRIVDTEVFGNRRENVYFLGCHDNRLERSRLRPSGASNASVYIKFANGTTLEDNTITGGSVQIRGGSSNTLLSGNVLSGGSVIVQDMVDRRFGRGTPSGTVVRGGRITSVGACVRVDAGVGTKIEDVTLQCPESLRVASRTRVAVELAKGEEKTFNVRCLGGSNCVEGMAELSPPLPKKTKRRR